MGGANRYAICGELQPQSVNGRGAPRGASRHRERADGAGIAGRGRAKAILAKRINDSLESRALTRSTAAALLGIPQPKISVIRHYKVRGISLERLMQALTALGQNVAEESVEPLTRSVSQAFKKASWSLRRSRRTHFLAYLSPQQCAAFLFRVKK